MNLEWFSLCDPATCVLQTGQTKAHKGCAHSDHALAVIPAASTNSNACNESKVSCAYTPDPRWQIVPCPAAHLQLLLGQASCLGLMCHIGLLGPPLLDHLCLGRCSLRFLLGLRICPSCAIDLQQGALQSFAPFSDVNKAPGGSVTIQSRQLL